MSETIQPGELDGLWAYLYKRAEAYRTAGNIDGAKALLKHILRQPDVSKDQRKRCHHLLATISYQKAGKGDLAAASHSKIAVRTAWMRSWDFVKSVALAPVHLVKKAGKGKELTMNEVVEYHNLERAKRIRRESGLNVEVPSRSHGSQRSEGGPDWRYEMSGALGGWDALRNGEGGESVERPAPDMDESAAI